MNRILVINSIPKSGTYLVARFLEDMGVANSGIHLREDVCWNFKNEPVCDLIADPDRFKRQTPIEQSLAAVQPGEFALAHLDFTARVEQAFLYAAATHVFLYRRPKDALVSHFRFLSDSRRTSQPDWKLCAASARESFSRYMKRHGQSYIQSALRQSEWFGSRGVRTVSFEDLMGDFGEERFLPSLQALLDAAGLDANLEFARRVFLKSTLFSPTRTFSGGRSQVEEVWSDDAEAIFVGSRGPALEKMLVALGGK